MRIQTCVFLRFSDQKEIAPEPSVEEEELGQDKIKSIIFALTGIAQDVEMTELGQAPPPTEDEMNRFLEYVERGKLDGRQVWSFSQFSWFKFCGLLELANAYPIC